MAEKDDDFQGIIFFGEMQTSRITFWGHKLGGCKLGMFVFCVVEYHKVWCEAGSWVGGEFYSRFESCHYSVNYTGHLLQE